MTKNPILNALAAALYIGVVVQLINLTSGTDNIAGPLVGMMALSLFTLSAAVMAMIFFYQPFRMYFDGEKQKAVTLVFQTILSFAVLVLILIAIIAVMMAKFKI